MCLTLYILLACISTIVEESVIKNSHPQDKVDNFIVKQSMKNTTSTVCFSLRLSDANITGIIPFTENLYPSRGLTSISSRA